MRIGVLTGGGDCPGLNAVTRAIVRKGVEHLGHEFVGYRDGWRGPLEGDSRPLGVPDVRGDPTLLREALLNVVSNAAEACAPLGATVTVRARTIVAPGGSAAPIVEIVVADTGPGIPRAHHGRLFVPGFTTKETGSGVGLAIAERVVTAHHGRITVDSDEGRGTTVTITLPTDKTGLSSLPMWSLP